MNIISAIYKNLENTLIDVEIEHPVYGVVPYTIDINNPSNEIDSEIITWLKTNTVSNFIEIPIIDTHLELAIKEAKDYLNNSQWYYIRKAETGEEIPVDILTKINDYLNFLKENGF